MDGSADQIDSNDFLLLETSALAVPVGVWIW